MSKDPIHYKSHRMFRWLLVQLDIEIVSANGALIPLIRTTVVLVQRIFMNSLNHIHGKAGNNQSFGFDFQVFTLLFGEIIA